MRHVLVLLLIACSLNLTPTSALAVSPILNLGPEQIIKATDADILVPGYSVPSFVDWNSDGLKDLIVGEGSGSATGKIRVYLNISTGTEPQFSQYFYVQSNGSDLTCPGSGCMGCFPRVVYWDADNRKDLLVGLANGNIRLYLNIGTDEQPTFDGGTLLQVGPPGSKTNISVGGARATPIIVDWNNDGKKDLVAGAIDGKIHIYMNEGSDTNPDFRTETFAKAGASDLNVGSRSSPDVLDLDCDGKKDLISGNTEGQIFFYRNIGTDESPLFSATYELVKSNGMPIDLAGTPRSRPFVCYWTANESHGTFDAYPDLLVGSGDGKIRLYRGITIAGDINTDGIVDCIDLAMLAQYWLHSDCGECNGADLAGADQAVNMLDLAVLADHWLNEICR